MRDLAVRAIDRLEHEAVQTGAGGTIEFDERKPVVRTHRVIENF
jgi:hypothetical protein